MIRMSARRVAALHGRLLRHARQRYDDPETQQRYHRMIAEWVADPSSRRLGLKDMSEIYLGSAMTHIEELIGKGRKVQIPCACL